MPRPLPHKARENRVPRERVLELCALLVLVSEAGVLYLVLGNEGLRSVTPAGVGLYAAWRARRRDRSGS